MSRKSNNKTITIRKVDKKVEKALIVNPINLRSSEVIFNRSGTTDEVLGLTILDPEIETDKKLLAVSNWLLEKGLDNAGFLAELYRYKGEHTRETREFKSQMKFDQDMLINAFVLLLRDASATLRNDLGIEKKDGGRRYFNTNPNVDEIMTALYHLEERLDKGADLIELNHKQITYERERAKGKGVYVDKDMNVNEVDAEGNIIKPKKDDGR